MKKIAVYVNDQHAVTGLFKTTADATLWALGVFPQSKIKVFLCA